MAVIDRNTLNEIVRKNPEAVAIIDKAIPNYANRSGIEQGDAFPVSFMLTMKGFKLSKDQQKAVIKELEAAKIEY
ncbi:MAG: hypothetical protein ACI3XD_09200 [Oscillospiraceae bacterium]